MRIASVLAVSIVVVVGSIAGSLFYAKSLPEVYTYSKSIHLARSQSDVWARLVDIQAYPSWRPSMRAVMPKGEDSVSLTEWNEVYTRTVLTSKRMHQLIPDSLVVEYTPEDRTSRSTWTWALEPLPPDSTLVTLSSTSLLASPMQRLVRKFFGGSNDAVDLALKDLSHAK